MRVAWYLGFGWPSIALLFVSGTGINLLSGPMSQACYVPFLIVAFYMTVRFRLFSRQPWRRVHSRAMSVYGRLAGREYETAKREGRDYDVSRPCRELASALFGVKAPDVERLQQEGGRICYYKALAEEFSELFVTGVPESRHDAVLDGVRRDIEASRLGPDVLIAREIELKRSRREAAIYLRELMLGRIG